MMDTKVGTDEKAPPADVAKEGWAAMKSGDAHVVAGSKNKLSAALSHVTPDSVLAGVSTICTESPHGAPKWAALTSSRAPSGVIARPPGLNGSPDGVTTLAKLIGVPAVLVAVLIGVTSC